jgi:hypothetical protein
LHLLVLTQPSRRPKLVGVKKKLDRRDAIRERKALSAAHIERSIEKELIERLKSKAYGDAPLNVNEAVWQAVLDRERGATAKEGDLADELELEDEESEEEEEEELEEEGWGDREFVSDLSGEEDGLSDLEDVEVSLIEDGYLLIPLIEHCRRPLTKTRLRRMRRMTKMVVLQKMTMRPRRQGRYWGSARRSVQKRGRLQSDLQKRQNVGWTVLAHFFAYSNFPQVARGWR